jgi:hypothetical protein
MRRRTEVISGNIFAVRLGQKSGPPTFAGSHMNTQVNLFFLNGALIGNCSPREEGMMVSSGFILVSKL